MRSLLHYIVIFLFALSTSAQSEFHVFPKDHKTTAGSTSGNGTLQNPWDLQTALSQSAKTVKPGTIIWLHEGIYNGRYISTLSSSSKEHKIVVSAFKTDTVILNGNVKSSLAAVLQIRGKNVIYKNFEITCLELKSRNEGELDFKNIGGLDHTAGENCEFINLKIYNNPGLGFGSWKSTGATLITECLVYNNGYISKEGKGRGEGFYVQNLSEEQRVIKNNIIFNNYYKGIEVWSAAKHANYEYVKNITLDNNVVFNSGLPTGHTVDNIIVASNDRNGINIAKNITVKNNILYHNTDYIKNQVNGNAPSLTLGFYKKAPIENVFIYNNIILGRNNALRILHAKSLTFTNNKVYSGYLVFTKSVDVYGQSSRWEMNNNQYYTKNTNAFRIDKTNIPFPDWKSKYKLDTNSEVKHLSSLDLISVLNIIKSDYLPNKFRVVLFNKDAQDVTIDFSDYTIKKGSSYTIKDIENNNKVLKSGTINNALTIKVPMGFENNLKHKTLNNFGVFEIEFVAKKKKRDNFFKRFFKWLF